MIQFLYHDGVQKEITALERRFRTIRDGLSIFERLCEKQLHRITQNDIWALWKVELVMPNSGLRPNQFPRMWFAVKGTIIVFLCISSHVDNYNDEEMNHLALSRAADFF